LYYLETFQSLERTQEENRRLLSLLEERDRKIATLEARIIQLQREMSQERDRYREENAALIRAMTSLATAK
jgi:predicted RNase H-like nuclease (RuvC/YqgF family)